MTENTLTNLENETLIERTENPVLISSPSPQDINWVYKLIAVRFSPFLVYILAFSLLHSVPTLAITLVTMALFTEFWLVKNRIGLELVGLRWSHEISESGGKPHYLFYSRPDPYIPDSSQVTCFWLFQYFVTFFWCLLSIISAMPNSKNALTWVDCFLALMASTLQIINLICFSKCSQQSSRQADDIARSVMLGDAFDSDNLEPEPEPEIDQQDPSEPAEKKKREIENPRLTLPVKPKYSNPEEKKEPEPKTLDNNLDNVTQFSENEDKDGE